MGSLAFRCFALPHHCHSSTHPLSISLSRASLSTDLLSPALPHASCLSPVHHPRCAYPCHIPPSAHCLVSIADGVSSPNTERYRQGRGPSCSGAFVSQLPLRHCGPPTHWASKSRSLCQLSNADCFPRAAHTVLKFNYAIILPAAHLVGHRSPGLGLVTLSNYGARISRSIRRPTQ